MAIHHADSAEIVDVSPLGDALASARTTTLYKSQKLELFRMVLLAGKQMPEHSVVGEVTVQCLEGRIEFSTGSTHQDMTAGQLICLAGGVPHALRAIEDSSVLVSLLLHPERTGAVAVNADDAV